MSKHISDAELKFNGKQEELLSTFKNDFELSMPYQQAQLEKVASWRQAYNGEPYGNETKDSSSLVSRDIKKQIEWEHANLMDPFTDGPKIMSASPITAEDKTAAQNNELILNYQFCRQFGRFSFMSEAVKLLLVDGTVVIKTGWDFQEREEEQELTLERYSVETNQMEQTKETVTKSVQTKNQPTAEICQLEDIFIDPTCNGNIDQAQFIIHRYETDLSALKKDGRYSYLDKIKVLDPDENQFDINSPSLDTFMYQDDPRKKMVLYEYWGNYDLDGDGIAEPIICSWIGETIIRISENPFPNRELPFLIVPYSKVPFEMYGESTIDYTGQNQKVATAIVRGLIVNMAKSSNGQVGVRKGMLDSTNSKLFRAQKNFEYNESIKDGFFQGSYNQFPSSALAMLEHMQQETESLTGVRAFEDTSIKGKNGSASVSAASVRRTNTLRNIAENLVKPLLRRWMSYNLVYLSDEEVIRITDNAEDFKTIARDDLKGNIDIDIEVATAESKANKAAALNFAFQTSVSSMNPEEIKILRAEIATLDGMPAFAKTIMEYQPQQSPLEALEMKKLEAEIAKIQSETGENASDERKAAAEAAVKEAQAAKLQRETEMVGNDIKDPELERLNAIATIATSKAKIRVLEAQAKKLDIDTLKIDKAGDEDAQLRRDMLRETHKKTVELNANIAIIKEQHKLDDKQLGLLNN